MSRPFSISVIGWTFIAVGGAALVVALPPLMDASERSSDGEHSRSLVEIGLPLVIRALAVLCGAFLLCGRDWARWLLIMWLAYHVVLGALHSLFGFAVHVAIFAIVACFLFQPAASAYFRSARTQRVQDVKHE
jgi:hypothetical protein